MFCSQCGKANVEGHTHCAACGAPLALPAGGLDPPLFAGFWRRVAAYIVDSFILFIPSLLLALLMPGLDWLLQVIIWIAYKTALEGGERQATFGKRALGIKVTGRDGGRISYGRAAGRAAGFFLSAVLLFIGLAMAGLTKRKQALHDMMSSTLVVNAGAEEGEVAAGRATATMPMTAGVWIAGIAFACIPLLGIVAAVAIPAYQDYVVRAKLFEVVTAGNNYKGEAQAAFQAALREGSTKPPRTVPASSPSIKRVTLDEATATIRVEIDEVRLNSSQVPAGSAIVYQLTPGGWTCRGERIAARFLPQACRT